MGLSINCGWAPQVLTKNMHQMKPSKIKIMLHDCWSNAKNGCGIILHHPAKREPPRSLTGILTFNLLRGNSMSETTN